MLINTNVISFLVRNAFVIFAESQRSLNESFHFYKGKKISSVFWSWFISWITFNCLKVHHGGYLKWIPSWKFGSDMISVEKCTGIHRCTLTGGLLLGLVMESVCRISCYVSRTLSVLCSRQTLRRYLLMSEHIKSAAVCLGHTLRVSDFFR